VQGPICNYGQGSNRLTYFAVRNYISRRGRCAGTARGCGVARGRMRARHCTEANQSRQATSSLAVNRLWNSAQLRARASPAHPTVRLYAQRVPQIEHFDFSDS